MDIMKTLLLRREGNISLEAQPCVCSFLVEGTLVTPPSQDSTRLPSFQGDPASPSERPVPAGGQEIDTGNWAAFDQGQFYAEDVVAGPSAAANNLQYFTPDPSVSSRVRLPPHLVH